MMTNDAWNERFRLVLAHFYSGNVVKMSKELAWDRSTLSRYKNGKATPPERLLSAIARATNVNLGWLKGQGPVEPIQYDLPSDHGSSGQPRLVTDELVRPVLKAPSETGQLVDGQSGMERMFRQVAPFHNTPDKYWLRMPKSIPDQMIKEKDYILIAVERDSMANHNDLGKLAVIKRPDGLTLDVVSEDDVSKSAKICGYAAMIERDLNY